MKCEKLEENRAKEYNGEIYCPEETCKYGNREKWTVYHPKLKMSCSLCKSNGDIPDKEASKLAARI